MLAPPAEAPQPSQYVVQADAIEFLRELPDASVDLLLMDPAYESLEKHRKRGTTTRLKQSKASSNEWFEIFPNACFPELLEGCFRVLKPRRHFYMLCDQETMFLVKPMAELCGFTFWKPIVWDKQKIGMGYHYRARYEFVLFFEKRGGSKGRKLNDLAIPDILQFDRVRGGYPTEKPVPLLETLITQSTQPGELVVDLFAGSGSTGVAARACGRDFMGCELDAKAAIAADARIATTEARL